jgi:nitrite reductase/ring-hydroxylating ferredoxin subunit
MDSSSRRSFMKAAVSASVFAATAPHQLLGKIMPNFTGDGDSILGVFTISLTEYPILNQVFGSVKITFTGAGMATKNAIVTRTSTSTFAACSDIYTHSGCSVGVYDVASGRLNCPCHGSAYKPDGTVVQGPAPSSLTPYKTTFTGGNTLQIEVAGLVNGIEDATDTASYLREISPNPVVGNAIVKFGLSSADIVVLAIYNSIGNKIMQLANQRFERGDYHIALPTDELSAGMYVCSISTANGFKVSHTFIVAK